MTLDQLQVLKAILETGSFRAASLQLGRAQSAVSYAIRTLEEELGFQLFDREAYRPELTDAGRAFAKQSDFLLEEFKRLQSSAEILKSGAEPLLRICVSALWPLPHLARVLSRLREAFPQTQLRILHDVLSADELLEREEADVALSEIFDGGQNLHRRTLLQSEMWSVCSPLHPLAALKGKARREELALETQVVLSSTLQDVKRSASILNPARTLNVPDFAMKREFLKQNLGWGFMPSFLIQEDLRTGSLVRTHNESVRVPLEFATLKRKSPGPALRALERLLQDEALRPLPAT